MACLFFLFKLLLTMMILVTAESFKSGTEPLVAKALVVLRVEVGAEAPDVSEVKLITSKSADWFYFKAVAADDSHLVNMATAVKGVHRVGAQGGSPLAVDDLRSFCELGGECVCYGRWGLGTKGSSHLSAARS